MCVSPERQEGSNVGEKVNVFREEAWVPWET